MRRRFVLQAVLGIFLIPQCAVCFAAESPDPNDSTKYLDAVREFADNVLKYGRDTYGPKHTPLFVDGLNIHTHEPVKWISPKGDVFKTTETEKWILSNFASQQTLLRTLDGLSKVTGDPKYRDAAMQAIKYVFENLRSSNGLIYWGHEAAYDAQADRVTAEDRYYYQPSWGVRHSLKLTHPYYELMWQVDPNTTKQFIESFWSAHILDWSNLDMNRIGSFNRSLEEPWNHEYKGGPVPFQSPYKYTVAFFNTGSILAHAGATLARLSGEEQPLVWSKRLIQRYIDTRDPNIGISAYIYNSLNVSPSSSSQRFPVMPFKYRILDYPEERHVHPWLTVLLTGELLGEKGRPLTQWVVEELTAWGKVSYRREDNSFVPMLIDGTNLEGYVDKQVTRLNVAEACPAGPQYFWAYSATYRATGDPFIWQMARHITLGNGFGDIGKSPSDTPELRTETDCSHAYGLLGFLQFYEKTEKPEFLEMARRIGDNIVLNKFHKGFFVPSKKHTYTMFDCFEPLALLHLVTTLNAQTETVPTVWPTLWKFISPYRFKQHGIDRLIIYPLTDSNEPPLSLQEAASIGNVDLVRMIIENGTDVDSMDDQFYKTALHRAVAGGHQEIVEFLLNKGADVNAQDREGRTPLHYASERGHKDVAKLLIDKGADVNAKNNEGQTAEDIANEWQIKLLIAFIVVSVPFVIGCILAIPLTFYLRIVADRPKRFFRYFVFLVAVFLLECAALAALLFFFSSYMLVFWLALAIIWGMVIGIWLRRRSSAKRVLKGVVAFAVYTSVPAVCIGIGIIIAVTLNGGEHILDGTGMPFPLNTILGSALTLGLGTVLLKIFITTGEVALLLRKHGAKE